MRLFTVLTPANAETRRDTIALDAILLARAFVHGAFLVWLLTTLPGWYDIFWFGSAFGLVDGSLGVLTAFLVTRAPVSAPSKLDALVLADALMRIATGIAIRLFPGIVDIPIVLVLFFGALGTWAAIAGVATIGVLLVSHGRHHRAGNAAARTRVHALFDPLAGAGLVALSLAAYAFAAGPPATPVELRATAAIASAVLTIIFTITAASATRAYLRPRSRVTESEAEPPPI
jgi:hypothetical protein